mmetsp:Transcript_64764/g.94855  ORF Transcript_64764/g.94855 Transcript_64764/m.94855 type:complete len:82 (+) Transcript_64764:1-246(+)
MPFTCINLTSPCARNKPPPHTKDTENKQRIDRQERDKEETKDSRPTLDRRQTHTHSTQETDDRRQTHTKTHTLNTRYRQYT